MKKNISIIIGIPTYLGGDSLVQTVKSLLKQKNISNFRIIVTVDGNPLSENVKNSIKHEVVEIWENKVRLGQAGRIKELIKRCEADILVLTQDDLLFDEYAVSRIIEFFKKNPHLTMVSAHGVVMKPKTLIERVVHVGVTIADYISANWNRGDNYLLASGRCLAFKTEMAKKFDFPNEIIDMDACFYLLNKRNGGFFQHASKSYYYLRSPGTLNEHVKQSKKYQILQKEVKSYFGVDLNNESPFPRSLMIRGMLEGMKKHPILLLPYLLLLIYTRFLTKNMFEKSIGFWDTDITTKKL